MTTAVCSGALLLGAREPHAATTVDEVDGGRLEHVAMACATGGDDALARPATDHVGAAAGELRDFGDREHVPS
jgi:hypothetical protein